MANDRERRKDLHPLMLICITSYADATNRAKMLEEASRPKNNQTCIGHDSQAVSGTVSCRHQKTLCWTSETKLQAD